MRTTPPLALLTALAALAVSASAQTERIVGLTSTLSSSSAATVDIQTPAFTKCAAASQVGGALNNNASILAGGSAYDPRHQAVWISDSRTIALYRLSDQKTLCSFKPTLQLSKGVVSGLAFSAARRELYQLETIVGQMVITIYDVTTVTNCKPSVKKGGCSLKLNAVNEWAGGLAFDEARSLFYYVTTWAAFNGFGQSIYAASRTNPCPKPNPLSLVPCTRSSTITGAAYSSCSKFLYVCTPTEVNVIRMDDPLKRKTTNMNKLNKVGCCQKQKGAGWAGMAVVPGFITRAIGKSCLGKLCPSCPNMNVAVTGGDPVLGNPDLAVTLTNAPAAGTAALYVSTGDCTKGISLPGFCGPVHVGVGSGYPILVGTLTMRGGATCGGSASFRTAVPVLPVLCGLPLCGQMLVSCPKTDFGITNAVQVRLGG